MPKFNAMSITLIIMLISSTIFLFHLNASEISGAFVYSSQYKGIDIKFYDETNKPECLKLLDLVPDKYFQGLKVIKVLQNSKVNEGRYYENGVLELYGCTFDAINHELTHHLQMLNKDSSYDIIHHAGRFDEFERQIFEEMDNGRQNPTESPGIIPKTGLAISAVTNYNSDTPLTDSSPKDLSQNSVNQEKYQSSDPFGSVFIALILIVTAGTIYEYIMRDNKKTKK